MVAMVLIRIDQVGPRKSKIKQRNYVTVEGFPLMRKIYLEKLRIDQQGSRPKTDVSGCANSREQFMCVSKSSESYKKGLVLIAILMIHVSHWVTTKTI